jgi:hypothetical protein
VIVVDTNQTPGVSETPGVLIFGGGRPDAQREVEVTGLPLRRLKIFARFLAITEEIVKWFNN